MTTHTPGPWLVETSGSYAIKASGPVGPWKAGDFTVASVGCSSPSDMATERANQKLIAAAPELLAALYRARQCMYGSGYDWLEAADAALTKAGVEL